MSHIKKYLLRDLVHVFLCQTVSPHLFINGLALGRVILSFGRGKSKEGLLLVGVTDVLTTSATVHIRVRRRAFAKRVL